MVPQSADLAGGTYQQLRLEVTTGLTPEQVRRRQHRVPTDMVFVFSAPGRDPVHCTIEDAQPMALGETVLALLHTRKRYHRDFFGQGPFHWEFWLSPVGGEAVQLSMRPMGGHLVPRRTIEGQREAVEGLLVGAAQLGWDTSRIHSTGLAAWLDAYYESPVGAWLCLQFDELRVELPLRRIVEETLGAMDQDAAIQGRRLKPAFDEREDEATRVSSGLRRWLTPEEAGRTKG